MKKIAIIIPTFNELDNIEKLIQEILKNVPESTIFIVDDSKQNEIGDLINSKNLKAKYFHRENSRGRGSAVLYGFTNALKKNQFDIFIEMDADFSHNPKDLVRIHEKLNDFDLVVGSRYVDGINVINWPLSRIILSYFASIYSRLITGMPIKDATSGFVGYKSKVLESINLESLVFNGYAFQIELKFKSYIKKFRLAEIPIIFKDRVYGESKMNGSIIFEAVFGLISMKIKSLLKD